MRRSVATGPAWFVLATAVAIGCSSAPSSTEGPVGSAGPSPSASTVATLPAGSSGPAGFVAGPGPFSLADPGSSLETIDSYRQRLVRTFAGTSAGASTAWSVTIEVRHDSARGADMLTVETTGPAPDKAGQVVSIGGVVYTVAAGRGCVGGVIDGADAIWAEINPAHSISAVVGAENAGSDTIGGIAADHFTFDERAIGLAGVARSTGELWTAADGGYLVKYVLETEGGPDYFGTDVAGTATWTYELLDVHAAIAIDVPDACPAGLVDAPMLPDARDVVSQAGLLSYNTATGLAKVLTFYENKAADLGWRSLEPKLTTETEGVLEYASSDGRVTIFVVAEGERTKVMIVLDRAAP